MTFRTTLVIALLVTSLLLAPVRAAASSSSNYQILEDDVGGNGRTDASSSNFTVQDGFGDAAAGDSSGTAYRQQTGPITANDPALTFMVDTGSVNLGALSASATGSGTATFRVLNYTSYGYIVQIVGQPPGNGMHSLAGMSSPAISQAGTEQFGINVTDNSSPDIGTEPVQVPSSSFSSGAAANGYNTANNFQYVSGDTIARAGESSGRTDYTISYIANISTSTPGGSYSGGQTLVVTGTY